MTPEFSRRLAKVVNSLYFKENISMEERWAFVDRVTKAKDFHELSLDDQLLVLRAEA